ncbi:MFS transporter [Lactobacillus sp. ESL0785]|uniref:MFS transporter n=1 Tax=Lactobacillus sp. ESL0785 TaxID=2983232 RepID=UPI0023F89903|nr:MFS transporter [Lactobacillus sp. ESL0785]WEV70746.1 MFS transporter [Lactobacillus sp. ESL0785]
MKNISHKSIIFKISVLSISLAVMLAPVISPALPLMRFPGVTKAQIDTLSTIPNLAKIFGILACPFLIRIVGQKKTILAGLMGIILLGIIPFFSSSYTVILAARIIVGLAFGIFMPLCTSLIVQLYRTDKNTMAHMMGYQNTIQTLGSALGSFTVGSLVTLGWHQAFLVYLIPIIPIILFSLFVTIDEPKKVSTKKTASKTKFKFTPEIALVCFFMLATLICYMPINFTLPRLIIQEKLGSASTAGVIAGIIQLATMATASLFGFMMKHVGRIVFSIGYLIIMLGYFLTSIANNIPFLLIALIFIGIGNSFCMPFIYNWMALLTDANTATMGQSILMIALNIGTVLSPKIVNGINQIMGSTLPSNIMLICACSDFCLAVIAFLNYLYSKNKVKTIPKLKA